MNNTNNLTRKVSMNNHTQTNGITPPDDDKKHNTSTAHEYLSTYPALGTSVYLPVNPHHNTLVDSDFFPLNNLPKSIAIYGGLYGVVVENISKENLLVEEVISKWGISNRKLEVFQTLTHWQYLQADQHKDAVEVAQ